MINNKQRGNQWERESAKILSLIISNGKTDKVVWRTASSGAYSTINKVNFQRNDLAVVNPEYEFNYPVECKCMKINRIYPTPSILDNVLIKLSNEYPDGFILLLKSRCGRFFITNMSDLIHDKPILILCDYNRYIYIYPFHSKLNMNRS